jgi:iron complex outermembrane receptor protein
VPNSRFGEYGLHLNMGYTGNIGTLKLFYDYFDQDLGMTTGQSVQLIENRSRKNEIWYQDLKHHSILLKNKFFLGKMIWALDLGYQFALRKLKTANEAPDIEMGLNTFTLDSKFYLYLDDLNEVIIGIQGMDQKNRNYHKRMSQLLADADLKSIGLFGVLQYTFFHRLKLQGGIRYDHYNIKSYPMGTEGEPGYKKPVRNRFQSLNGSAGATYHLHENLLLRSNISKSFRAPNLAELTSNGIHAGRYEVGDENLHPQEAIEVDLSLHLHTDNISLDIAGFNNHITDYIYLTPTEDTTDLGDNIYRFAQSDAHLYGGEVGIHFHPRCIPWLHLQASYSQVRGVKKNGDDLPFIPAGKFRYEVRAEKKQMGIFLKPNIQFSGLIALEQSKISFFEIPTSGYQVFDISFNTDLKIGGQYWNVGLSINNIFNTAYFDHLSNLKQLGYYNQGREICFRLKIPFSIKRTGN